jgi:hypothetical protein
VDLDMEQVRVRIGPVRDGRRSWPSNGNGDLGLLPVLRDELLQQLDDRDGTGAHWFAAFQRHRSRLPRRDLSRCQ